MESWPSPTVPRLPGGTAAVTELSLYDTARQSIVPVGPPEGTARMYVCGITPYDATHLGHAFTYLTFDLAQRVWRDLGLEVAYVQNITDVDDPLLERAAATGVPWQELATAQIDLFRGDMTALRVLPPDHYIGVIECVPCVISLMHDLQAAGSVYQIEDPDYPDWYFRCSQAPGFGDLSHVDPDTAVAVFAERGGDPDRPGKHDPLDCLVWRMERPGEPAWPSPWGRGRPGWHIECTAIALRYLGADFDLQGGGVDLVFPHHEMCAAEAITATREPLAQSFVHTGMVGLDGAKMSKSVGNLELVSRLMSQGADPMAIRLALIEHHYRSDWEWTPDQLTIATQRLARWRAGAAAQHGPEAAPVIAAMREAMRADLDVAAATAAVDAWVTTVEAGRGSDPKAGVQVSAAIDALLGVAL